jgi:hypothetical protein
MTPFARNCWYWNYWNTLIEEQLSNVDDSRKFKIKLEDLDGSLGVLQKFLGLEGLELNTEKSNQAYYPLSIEWTDENISAFETYCSKRFGY